MKPLKHYTGIGSRTTPDQILAQMTDAAAILDARGYTLRSGGADGADTAFEAGASPNTSQIFLPWRNFNRHSSPLYIGSARVAGDAATKLAKQFHPAWHKCSSAARLLHARNCFQLLGARLDSPTDFVICWTPDGAITGGTAQALRLAKHYQIPVYNLGAPDGPDRLQDLLNSLS